VGLRSEGVEDTSKLDSNVSGADDSDPLGLLLNFEESIRVDSVRSTGDLVVGRDGRTSTNSNDNLLGLDVVRGSVVSSDLDLVLVYERCPTLMVGDLVVDQVLLTAESTHVSDQTLTRSSQLKDALDSIQPSDVSVPLLLEVAPVKLGKSSCSSFISKSIVWSLSQVVSDVGSVPHDLLGHTSCRKTDNQYESTNT